ncbi:modulator of smoothened protein [Dermatophagoides farinae]|nr:modulator of smoothened protein-like [Dermatophagoides farinae]
MNSDFSGILLVSKRIYFSNDDVQKKMDIQNFDNHTSISIIFFTIVDFIVLFALFLPEWIVSHVGGDVQIGLWKICILNQKRIPKCFSFSQPLPWKLAIIFIIIGCFFNTLAIIVFIKSFKNPLFRRHGRWLGLFTLFFFSLASLFIPIGFSVEQIKGELFQLPSSFYAGQAYILFNMSIWITAISEVFAARLCFFNF